MPILVINVAQERNRNREWLMMAREDANMSLERHKDWERVRALRGNALRKV